jgi:PKHD-type hydroxylase
MIYRQYVVVLENYLTAEEVEYIHGYAFNLPTIEGRLGFSNKDKDGEQLRTEGETGNTDNTVRQSTNRWLEHDPQIKGDFDQVIKQKIFDGMVHANQVAGWNYEIDGMETWQYTIYEAQPDRPTGDFYTWHTDSGPELYPNGKTRKVSCTVQLSDPDEYEGGHFQWLESMKVFDNLKNRDSSISPDELIHTAPFSGKTIGSLIVFPSWLHHQVTPVTHGIRKSLVVWNTGWPLK